MSSVLARLRFGCFLSGTGIFALREVPAANHCRILVPRGRITRRPRMGQARFWTISFGGKRRSSRASWQVRLRIQLGNVCRFFSARHCLDLERLAKTKELRMPGIVI